MSNPRIGAHKSIVKSIDLAIDRAVDSTCESLQIFSRPPRRWLASKSLTTSTIDLFIQKSNKANFYDTAIHMPYLPNIASPNKELFEKSIKVLIEEINTSRKLRIPYIVTHLGSPKGNDESFAAKRVAKALDSVKDHIQKSPEVMILLENSTAKRKPWGTKLENFEEVFTNMNDNSNTGICFDTAHAFSAGYDIREPEGLNETIDRIEDLVGKNKVKMFHINDSKGELGSGIDHHEHIGQGAIGINCFRELMQNPRFDNLPMILETPKENMTSDKLNLDLLRKLRSRRS